MSKWGNISSGTGVIKGAMMKKVLIVDDNDANLYLLKSLLEGEGIATIVAKNGQEALDRAQDDPPDLIVSDILMPVMDGYLFCRKCKADERLRRIPFVFYTATYTEPKDEKFAMSLGADRFVIKPQEPEILIDILKEVWENQSAAKPAEPKPLGEEMEFFRQYNAVLFRKLEKKILDLETAHRKLKCLEEQYRLSFENVTDIVCTIDADFIVRKMSPSVERMLGYKSQDFIDRPFSSMVNILAPESMERAMAEIHSVLEGETIPASVYQIVARDGTAKYGEISGSPIRRGDEIVGIVSVVRDITERRRAEEAQEKLQAQLIQAQKMESVGRLAGGAAHDFNNMLGLILGHAELALERIDPTHPLHADLQEIKKAAERSANLTRQLLAFARKQTITPKVLELNETVAGMLKMLQRLIGENIELRWQPEAHPWPVKMDPSQLDQILANLCINARDAISGVGNLTIETANITFDEDYCAAHAGFVPGEYVRLAVSDDGCGMDKETMSHLFEPFFTTKEIGKGTGLGLATIYGAVKQNNGFINVYSEPGQGTTFTIYLPRHRGKAGQAQPEGKQEPAQRGRETILLVDDEPDILRLTTMLLERQGYTVLAASTPGAAIRLAREHIGELHLLMTDVVMPEMNGRDLAKNILALYPHLKRLFTSGYTANVIAHQGVLEEGVHFIQKPFSINNLAAKVREVLDQP